MILLLAVIVEEKVELLNEFLGVEFCSELSLLTENFIEKQVGELNSIGINNIVYFGENEPRCCKEITFISDYNDLCSVLKKNKKTNILVTFSNVFFQFKNQHIDLDLIASTSVSFAEDDGNVGCVFLNKKLLYEALNSQGNNNLMSFFCNKSNLKLNCFENIVSVSEPRDYGDILNMLLKSDFNALLPKVAEGIYALGDVPKGDYVIIPPVFFGNNVQIEDGCVIGPRTVLFDNCLVSKNSYIKSSVLMSDTYISSGCFIDYTICGENVSVRRDSAVFEGSVLGNNVTIGEGVFLESESHIRPFTNVSEYKNSNINYKNNESCWGFCGYTPEKAALLAGSIGSLYKNAKIGILINNEYNAKTLKYAVISGLMSTGIECFDLGYGYISLLQFGLNFCDLDCGIFINGQSDGTMISIINKSSLLLPKDDFYAIKENMLNGSIVRCTKKQCKPPHIIKGIKHVYIRSLTGKFKENIRVLPEFICENSFVEDLCKEAFLKLKSTDFKLKIKFLINADATICECVFNDKKYSHNELCSFVSFYTNSDNMIDSKLWRNDAVFLCFRILEILSLHDIDFSDEMKRIPAFYIAEKVIFTEKKMPYIASRLSEKSRVFYKEDELILKDKDLHIKYVDNGKYNKIKILARNHKSELAEELIGDIIKLLS